MATAHVRIKDRSFTQYQGRYFEYLDSKSVEGNGWECFFKNDGTLICKTERKYSDGWHTMLYVIYPNGFSIQKLIIEGLEPTIIKKGYVVPKGQEFDSGLLGLSGGYVDNRYAYFRYAAFQDFLDKYGITAISRKDPNTKYNVRSSNHANGISYYSVWTDGVQKVLECDIGHTEEWRQQSPGTCSQEKNITISVEKATWVVIDQNIRENNRNCHSRILYTNSDVLALDLSAVLE